jgi:hypothetical protein
MPPRYLRQAEARCANPRRAPGRAPRRRPTRRLAGGLLSTVRAVTRDDAAGARFDDVVSKSRGIFPVVCDVNHSDPERMLQSYELASQLFAKIRVETRKRLIVEQNTWLTSERPCECNALLLSAESWRG